MGEQNIARLIAASSRVYGRYMTQAMSRIMRVPVASGTLFSAVLEHNEARLVQHGGPKLALQVLLGILTACAVAAWILLPANQLLPHNPCSIAGVGVLLAGRNLWPNGEVGKDVGLSFPEGAQWMGDAELRKVGLWDGLLVEMLIRDGVGCGIQARSSNEAV